MPTGSASIFASSRCGASSSKAEARSAMRRHVAVAFVFLTRLPLRLEHGFAMRDVAAAAYVFPLVGACIGLAGGLVYLLGSTFGLSPGLGAILAVAAMVLVTGALHEDGLA